MPSNYTLIRVSTPIGDLKLYTHYEGLFVIDEIILAGQHQRGLMLNPQVVVDVGAHIGTFTLLSALNILKTHGKGVVVSLEPVSINYTLLINNIKANQFEHVVIPVKAALYPKAINVKIGWLGIKEMVRSITMDDVMKIINNYGYSSIDLLKIDVEGVEIDILTQNNEWLRYINAIVIELHPWIYGNEGVNKIVKALRNKGFNVRHIERYIEC